MPNRITSSGHHVSSHDPDSWEELILKPSGLNSLILPDSAQEAQRCLSSGACCPEPVVRSLLSGACGPEMDQAPRRHEHSPRLNFFGGLPIALPCTAHRPRLHRSLPSFHPPCSARTLSAPASLPWSRPRTPSRTPWSTSSRNNSPAVDRLSQQTVKRSLSSP